MQLKPINYTIAVICNLLVIVIALTCIVGWLIGDYRLVAFSSSMTFPSMKVNTAICVFLIAAGQLLISPKIFKHSKDNLIHWCIGISLSLSFIAFFEHLTNTIIGIDEFFLHDPWSSNKPGLMSLATATTILLGNFVLLSFVHAKNNDNLISTLLFLFTINPLIAVSTYLYGPEALFQVRAFATLSLPTASAFSLLLIGFLLTSPGHGRSALWQKNDFAAKGFRSLSVSLITLNFAIGIAIAFSESRGLILPGFGFALFSATSLLAITFILGSYAEKIRVWQARLVDQQAETKKLETALIETLEISSEGILLVDQTGAIVHANTGCETIFHWDKKSLLGKPIETLMPEHFRKKHPQLVRLFMASPQEARGHKVRGNIIALTQDGIEKSVSITLSKHNIDTNNRYVAAVIQEGTFIEPKQAKLQPQVKTDSLTGCLNREAFDQYILNGEQYHQRQEDKNFGVLLLLEIDFISVLQQKYDSQSTEFILANFAQTIQRNLRTDDKVFRYTDTRFLLISPTIDADEATLMAERIRTGTKITPTYVNNENVYFTCSIIIMTRTIPTHQRELRTSIERAETKLSENQKLGRDQLITI